MFNHHSIVHESWDYPDAHAYHRLAGNPCPSTMPTVNQGLRCSPSDCDNVRVCSGQLGPQIDFALVAGVGTFIEFAFAGNGAESFACMSLVF